MRVVGRPGKLYKMLYTVTKWVDRATHPHAGREYAAHLRERGKQIRDNAIRRKLITTVDASLAHAGADDETRRPVMYLLDEAVEKHLRDVSETED